MRRPSSRTSTARRSGLALVLAGLGAVGCGSDPARAPATREGFEPRTVAEPTQRPEGPLEPSPVAKPPVSEEPTPDGALAPADEQALDFLSQWAIELLETRCSSCHADGDGGPGALHDVPRSIASGLILPGSGATSPVVLRLLDGSAPHAGARSLPSVGETALLARWIDQLPVTSPEPCIRLPFRSLDEDYALLAADIGAQPASARPFIRYLGLTYTSNAGSCGPALERQRWALFQAINSVSIQPDIARPVAIDASGLIYRIDLRQYGWERGLDVDADGVAEHADAWLALLAAASPHAAELSGPEADLVHTETGSAVAYLPVNAFVHAVTGGALYNALVGAPPGHEQAWAALGDEERGVFVRAGFSQNGGPWGPSREALVARAAPSGATERQQWFIVEMNEVDSESLYDAPFEVNPGLAHQVIFNLPNGLQAYLMIDPDGERVDGGLENCRSDVCRAHAPFEAGLCNACHGSGLLPARDEIRSFTETNFPRYGLSSEELAAVLGEYPVVSEFDALVRRDTDLHRDALERAGVPTGAADPASSLFLQFEREPLTLARAAGELGASTETLQQKLTELDPRLHALQAPGGIDRATLNDAFHAAQCVLLASAQNRPVGCP